MTTNSASGDFKGPVVQAQSIHGNVSFRGGPPDYSHYSSQVERIAPSKLIGREDELGDLAHFCTSPDYEGRYSWWQAEAWSGKSALLATFTLNPPDNVRVIAFFVTAAWSNQSDRRAFVDNILEQLWALLGKEPQRDIPETARETHMIGLLEAAAQHCGYRNERLVLVVDGLDEDRGRDGTEEDHSIGAILPATPPAGMRVIVSGRPSPPLPNDMPDDHPLHDASIVRQLDPSHEARAVRDIMQRDLKRLFRGSKIEQDILGLVTAAGGGLTTSDLAELIGISEWQVEDYLHQAAGRSFRRESEKFGGSLQAHFLAHEQLEAMAHSMLGPQLDSYKERLHRWASSFRERKWPESTPEFLLRGYFNMLVYSGDIDGMIDCATDPHRHNLTRFRVGGDGESINEIMTTQNMIMNTHNPDLESLSRLAVHRVHLQQSNRRIPAGLPAGWARLHQFERAESMTEAIRDPFDRIDARLATAKVCRIEGEVQRSDKLLEQAEQQAQNVDQFWGAGPIESIADTFAGLGDYARAEHVADLISNPAERVKGLFLLVCTAVDDEEYDLARRFVAKSEELLCSDTAGNWASALGAMAVSLRKVGQTERADKLLGDAESALLAEKPPLRRAGPVAQYAALYGDYDRAIRMLGMIDDCASHDRWVRRVISIIAEYDGSRAEKLARSTSESVDASRFCVRLSEVAENDSQSDRAIRLYEEAHNIAYNISDKEAKDNALIAVAIAAANIGKTETAASIAHQYAESGTDSYSLFLVTAAVFRADDFASGVNLLELTENVSRRITSTADERRSLLWIRTMADFQDFDRAERVAKNIRDESARSAAWAVVTEGLLSAGEVNRAERSLSGIQDVSQQRRARLDIIRSLLSDGAVGRATTIAKSAANMADQSDALLVIMEETRNEAILDDVERLVEAMVESKEKLLALLGAVGTAARTHFRSHTVSLLEKLRSVAENCVEHLEDPTDTRIKGIVRTCSTRMRTLTEMSDTVDHHKELIRSRWPKGLLGDIVPPYPPGNSHKNAPAGKEIAFKLANQDWHYSVEDATASCPDCYYAVVHELDKVDELL